MNHEAQSRAFAGHFSCILATLFRAYLNSVVLLLIFRYHVVFVQLLDAWWKTSLTRKDLFLREIREPFGLEIWWLSRPARSLHLFCSTRNLRFLDKSPSSRAHDSQSTKTHSWGGYQGTVFTIFACINQLIKINNWGLFKLRKVYL